MNVFPQSGSYLRSDEAFLLVTRLRALLDQEAADQLDAVAEAEVSGERPDLDPREVVVPVGWLRQAVDLLVGDVTIDQLSELGRLAGNTRLLDVEPGSDVDLRETAVPVGWLRKAVDLLDGDETARHLSDLARMDADSGLLDVDPEVERRAIAEVRRERREGDALPHAAFRALQRWSFLSPPLGGVKAVRDRGGRWIDVYEAGEVVDAMREEADALRDAMRTLCIQREGHFHTAAAWAAARQLVGLEPEERR